MQQLTFNVVDNNGVWERIEHDFLARLPLRNLIWKGGLTQSARFIEQLDIKVTVGEEEEEEERAGGRLLNIFLLESDADADTYKAVLRGRVKAWAGRVAQRKGEGWLVVYAASAAEAQRAGSSGSKFLGMRATVFDRLRGDLPSGHVALLQAGAVESWNALVLAVRERVVQALEERVAGLADEMRRMDANRMLPGWNFCRFFVLKEGVVRLYRLMGLHDEALAQYDELEAVFFQLLGAQRLSWFSAFGGAAAGDDYSDVLDTGKRDYARQLAATTISLFDLRTYLFGRQAQLLVALGQHAALAERAQRFVTSFGRSMREPGTGLSGAFVAAWTYSTCMNVAEILEGAEDGADARALAAAKAGFLAGARQQLDELGVLWQRLPREDSNDLPRMPSTDLISISNPVLAEALASDERFDQIYVRTCEQAAQYYGESGRRRFARAMQGDVAQLLARRGQWDGAARLLRTLVPGDDGDDDGDGAALSAMDVLALERLAECERRLGNARQSLECAVRLIAQRSDRHEESAAMLGELCGALRARTRVAGALFSAVGVAAVERSGALCVAVRIRSRVAAAADRVAAVLACGDGDGSHRLEIEFSARDVGLARGETAVLLTADAASCAGRFTVAAVLVAIGGAEFVAAASAPLAVRLAEHPASPAVRLGPACAADAGSRALRVAVHTRATRVAPGMRIRLFDARAGTPLPVTRCGHAGFAVADGGALVASAAMDAGLSVEADVALGGDPLGPPITAVTACALFSTPAGERRVFVGTASVDPAPALAVSAHAVALGGARVAVVLRAQCVADRLRLASLRAVAGDSALDFKAVAGAMRQGDVATAVCELAAADDAPEGLRLQGEARFAMPDDEDDDDDTFTLRTLRFDVACSSSAAAALAVAVRMTAASRFCCVLEPTPLAVRLRIVGPTAAHSSSRRRPHRLRVTVAERGGGPARWLIAGAAECEVAVGDADADADAEVCLEYSLVALAPGFLRLPDVVCTDAEEPGRLLHTLVDADYPTLCAVPNHGTVAAYSVPVVVRA